MKIQSKRSGLTVIMTDEEYATIRATYGDGAHEHILNHAGRIHKHRQQLAVFRAQQLTDEQSQSVEKLARVLAMQELIDNEIREMGYGNYLVRRDCGGMMPESFTRIVERARQRTDEYDIIITDQHRDYALKELGFLTERDREWSHGVIGQCDWQITVPDGWGGENFATVPLGF